MLSFLSYIFCGIVSCAFFLFLLSLFTFYVESFTIWSIFFLALLWFYSFSTPIILSALAILFLLSVPKFRKLLITGFAMKQKKLHLRLVALGLKRSFSQELPTLKISWKNRTQNRVEKN